MRKKKKLKSSTKIGNSFHDKTKNILEKCGFHIDYSNYNKPGEDIIVSFGKTKILVQCKKSEKNIRINIQDLIDSYATKVKKRGADAAIIITSGVKIPSNYLVFHEKDRVAVWDENVLLYYSSLCNKINAYSIYQILSDLNIHQPFSEKIVSPALEIKQTNQTFLLTKLPVSWIIKASYVLRRIRTGDTRSYQRLLSEPRVKQQIPDHLNDGGIFPNSVILVSREHINYRKGLLTLASQTGTVWIMDGQHRIYSFANVKNKDVKDDFEIPCVVFDGVKVSKGEQAQIFVDINQNAKTVSRSLTLELKDSFGLPVELGVKLVKSLQTLAFIKNRIRMYAEKSNNKNTISFVTLATNQATESIIKQIKVPSSKKGKLADEFRLKKIIKIYRMFYSALYSIFKKEWDGPDKYVFSTDKGVRALAHLLQIMLQENPSPSLEYFEKIFRAMRKGSPIISTDLTKRSYAGESGAKELAKNWVKSARSGGAVDFGSSEVGLKEVILNRTFIKKGETKLAIQLLDDWMSNFTGKVFGRFNYGDITTLDLLSTLLPSKVKEAKLIIDVVREQKPGSIKQKIEEIRKKRKLDIKLIKVYREGEVDGKTVVFPVNHGRWIADENFRINPELDLSKSSLASKRHEKCLIKTTGNNGLKEFNLEWDFLIEHKDTTIQLYE